MKQLPDILRDVPWQQEPVWQPGKGGLISIEAIHETSFGGRGEL